MPPIWDIGPGRPDSAKCHIYTHHHLPGLCQSQAWGTYAFITPCCLILDRWAKWWFTFISQSKSIKRWTWFVVYCDPPWGVKQNHTGPYGNGWIQLVHTCCKPQVSKSVPRRGVWKLSLKHTIAKGLTTQATSFSLFKLLSVTFELRIARQKVHLCKTSPE